MIGFFTVGPVLFGNYFGDAIQVLEQNDVVRELATRIPRPVAGMPCMRFAQPPFWLTAAGVFTAWLFFLKRPRWRTAWRRRSAGLRTLLVNKYYFDWFNEKVIAALSRGIGFGLWKGATRR